VLRGRTETVVGAEQDQIVSATELDEHRVDGSDLGTVAAAGVAQLGGFDVIFAVRLQEYERGEALDQRAPCLGAGKTLQQFLQHEASGEDLVCSVESVLQRFRFRGGNLGVPTEGQGLYPCRGGRVAAVGFATIAQANRRAGG
jgi:hypothetical protein